MDSILDRAIYYFNNQEAFTIRDACEGVQIFGGIGSGKTSGSGEALAKSYMRSGFGGLVLCAKTDVLDDWIRYAKETGRSHHVLVFDDSGKFVFPFLQYEMERKDKGAGYTENLISLFTVAFEALDGSQGIDTSEPFWKRSMKQLLRNIISLCVIVRGEVSIPLIYQVVMSAPKDAKEVSTYSWQQSSLCWQLLEQGHNKAMDKWQSYDFESTAGYWLGEYPNIPDKTRSSIITMLTTMAEIFMRSPFRMLLSEPEKDYRKIAKPELTHEGAIIILNLSVKQFGDAGRAVQVIYKYIWQQSVERRHVDERTRPVFLWMDEAQNFVTEYDMQFQATARSKMVCTVYMTQNLPNYYAQMGGEQGKNKVDALIGNLQTKIWHANSDPVTNDHAAEVIGKSWQTRKNIGESFGSGSFNLSTTTVESLEHDVTPQSFTRLRKGGTINQNVVDAIVFQSGRIWQNRKTYLLAQFKQQRNA